MADDDVVVVAGLECDYCGDPIESDEGSTICISCEDERDEVAVQRVRLQRDHENDLWGITSAEEWAAIRATMRGQVAPEPEPDRLGAINDDVDITKLSLSPRGVHEKVTLLGWTTTLRTAVVHVGADYMASDGKVKKDGTRSMKGDLKKAAHDVTHLFMHAVDKTRHVGFTATWTGNSFTDAIIQDPIGVYITLAFDYKPSQSMIKGRGKERAEQEALFCDIQYNDGKEVRERRHLYTKTTDLNEWLTQWMTIAGIEQKPKTPPKARKPKGVYTTEDFLAPTDWIAA